MLCPIEYDQFFWAERAHALGVAPPMLALSTITAAHVQAAMVRAG
jgi:UDP:flavonoid glycosyltransferase YjiC (YdhE family)